MATGNRDADVQNRLVDTGSEGRRGGVRGERSTDMRTAVCASELLGSYGPAQGAQPSAL